jgi:hypothetical protein
MTVPNTVNLLAALQEPWSISAEICGYIWMGKYLNKSYAMVEEEKETGK